MFALPLGSPPVPARLGTRGAPSPPRRPTEAMVGGGGAGGHAPVASQVASTSGGGAGGVAAEGGVGTFVKGVGAVLAGLSGVAEGARAVSSGVGSTISSVGKSMGWIPDVYSAKDPARVPLGPSSRLDSPAFAPEHLYLLCHGLGGSPGDLAYLKKAIYDGCCTDGERESHSVLVHVCTSNYEGPNMWAISLHDGMQSTFDGIDRGGARVADELRGLVKQYPSLRRLTMVGNSLGGMYARYCAAECFDPATGKVAGLEPVCYATTATPHLGVRNYLWVSKLPSALVALGSRVGRTVMQLNHYDGEREGEGGLVLRMATESRFVDALKAFKERAVYTNAKHDSLVAYETAGLSPGKGTAPDTREFDRDLDKLRHELKYIIREDDTVEPPPDTIGSELELERRCAEGLTRSMRWRRVVAYFPEAFAFPTAHNKICANKRNLLFAAQCADGEYVVRHLAAWLNRHAR